MLVMLLEKCIMGRAGERQLQAILRLVYAQLRPQHARAQQATSSYVNDAVAVLDTHLGSKVPVVLLIDELNSLDSMIDAEASQLLKILFLDKPNRYLIFSAHEPMTLVALLTASIGIPDSSRGTRLLELPDCFDLHGLR